MSENDKEEDIIEISHMQIKNTRKSYYVIKKGSRIWGYNYTQRR
jgi:hypothetical protein